MLEHIEFFKERLSNIKITPTGCLEWTGCKFPTGYGVFGKNINKKKTYFRAHRAAWVVAYGEIPKGLFVCHKCDNTSCVNPEHLFLGTALDNNRDKSIKGRAKNQNTFKTTCKNGHEFSKENTICYKDRRYCRKCMRKHTKTWAIKKVQVNA